MTVCVDVCYDCKAGKEAKQKKRTMPLLKWFLLRVLFGYV